MLAQETWDLLCCKHMNLSVAVITAVPVAILGWLYLYPAIARELIIELKRRYRLYLISQYGKLEYQYFANEFRKKMARLHYSKVDVETMLSEHKDEVIDRLGTKVANAKLGEPTPLERYF